ncbi:MAG: HepT-like ribonuclease domain-containing protein [Candidatus Bathyarchaeia archaeon]
MFGSYVHGRQRKRSDLDILVEFEDESKPSLLEFIGLQEDLGNLLRVKVDLVEKKGLKPYIGRRILEEVVYVSDPKGVYGMSPAPEGGSVSRNRRREIRDYLKDILDNLADVEQFTRGIDYEAFSSDKLKVYAVLHALLVVGEATRKIPASIRKRHPAIPWRSIVGLRNIVAHEYFAVNLPRIWQIIGDDLPRLREAVARMWKDLGEENNG